jgi:hypothetical protein
MAEFNQNFNMFQGDTKDLEIKVTGNDGEPLNLAGSLIEWRLYRSVKEAAAIYKSNQAAGGIEVIDAPGGIFQVHLSSEDTEEKNLLGKYQHEARITDVRGYIATILTGYVVINQNYG